MKTNSFTPRPVYLQETSRQHLVNRTTSELQDMSKLCRVKKKSPARARHRIGFLVYSSRNLITIFPELSRRQAPELKFVNNFEFLPSGKCGHAGRQTRCAINRSYEATGQKPTSKCAMYGG